MDLYVLDDKLDAIGLVDSADSVIWTARYYSAGDFEITVPATSYMLELLRYGRRLRRKDSDMVGVVKTVETTTDEDRGATLLVKGPCLKSLLGQRIVWGQMNYTGTVGGFLRRVIEQNAILPAMPERRIEGLSLAFAAEMNDKIDVQVTGSSVQELVETYCKLHGFGWNVDLVGRSMQVRFFSGVDRSRAQSERPRVTFSPAFDNLAETSYFASIEDFANTALVAGEGEGSERILQAVGNASGLDRYELYVDARDLSSKGDTPLSPAQYAAALASRGNEKLAEHMPEESYDGNVQHDVVYSYGRDYGIGDIVDVISEQGVKGTARITEVIECEDAGGYTKIPTFGEWKVVG